MNGRNFILWTESEGGFFKAIVGAQFEEYEEARASGVLRLPGDIEDAEPVDHPLKFIAYGTIAAHHDFVLGGERVSEDTEMWDSA